MYLSLGHSFLISLYTEFTVSPDQLELNILLITILEFKHCGSAIFYLVRNKWMNKSSEKTPTQVWGGFYNAFFFLLLCPEYDGKSFIFKENADVNDIFSTLAVEIANALTSIFVPAGFLNKMMIWRCTVGSVGTAVTTRTMLSVLSFSFYSLEDI